tara:strand:- start:25 stop:306 length:282 start_codon:yes stop_codon:yes gene_type:complete
MDSAIKNKITLKYKTMFAEYNKQEEKEQTALLIGGVIERIEEYAPKPIELTEFDLTKKADYIYCVEWGMKKAKRNEWEVYKKMLKELKEKYVL